MKKLIPLPSEPLVLVRERKLFDLLHTHDIVEPLEASGVYAKGNNFYVIFDNVRQIARIKSSLSLAKKATVLFGEPLKPDEVEGFEDIAYNEKKHEFYMLIESIPEAGLDREGEPRDGIFQGKILRYNEHLTKLDSMKLNYKLDDDRKGFEGLRYIYRNGKGYLLGLCEGNKCCAGEKGKKPGGGRIQIFREGKKKWRHVGQMKLPKAVQFEDYAAFGLLEGKIAVVSQASAKVWIGTFHKSKWKIVDDGQMYTFPKNAEGKQVYCNVEGVSWITPTRLVFVSDQRKPGSQSICCNEKDQSIHIFKLPTAKRRASEKKPKT